jgi:hypothetical protein
MRNIKQTIHRGKNNPVFVVLAAFAWIPCAKAQVEFFSEDFTGPLDTGVWSQNGNANGHTGIEDGSYVMTAENGAGGTKLVRFIDGTAGSFRNEIEVDPAPSRILNGKCSAPTASWKSFSTALERCACSIMIQTEEAETSNPTPTSKSRMAID